MFGNSFGQPTQPTASTSFGFGQPAAPTTAATPAFGASSTPAFGQTSSTAAPPSALSFGAPATASAPTAFGNPAAVANGGTTKVPWAVHEEKDKDPRLSNNKTERYFGITMMPQYNNNSFNELRLQDYENNVKGPTNQASATGFGFGQPTNASTGAASSPFGTSGSALPSPFNNTASTFGQPSTAPAPAFGATANPSTAFGSAAPTTSAFGTPSAFGASNAAPPGSSTPSFGFGLNNNQNNSSTGNLFGQPANPSVSNPFGAKPPGSSAFGQPANNGTGFGFNNAGSTTNSSFGASATPQNSLFGNSAANNAPFGAAKPSLFGNSTNNQSAPAGGGGLFGQTGTAPSNSTNLFGQSNNTNSNPSGGFGSSFGQNAASPFGQTNSGSAFGQINSAAGSGFGLNSAQNKPASGGLFGQPTTPTNNAFGSTNSGTATNSTSGLFGSKPATGAFGQPAASNTATSGFGFAGQPANNATSAFNQKPAFGASGTPAPGNAGGGLFGSAGNTNPSGTSLFGNTNTNSGTGSSLFGNNNNTNNNTNQANTGTGFGSGSTSGGLFGNNSSLTSNTNANSGQGLFGGGTANANSNNNQTSTGLFNKPAGGSSLFGQNNQNTGTSSLFGQNNQNNGGGAFGQSTFGQPNNNNQNNNNNNNQNNNQGGLFGNKPSTGLFGNSTAGSGSTLGSGGLFGNANTNLNANNASGLNSQAANGTGGSLFRGAAQGPSGPVASIDSNAYLNNPLFANIRPSSDTADTSVPSAKPRKESSNFKAPSGVLLAQIMQPRPLPQGRRIAEPLLITGSKAEEPGQKQLEVAGKTANKASVSRDSTMLNKFRNAIFSNHTDEVILNTAAFDFSRRRDTKLIAAAESDEITNSSTTSQVATTPEVDEEFEVLSPSGSAYDGDDEDYVAARQLNPDGSVNDDLSLVNASLNEPDDTSVAATANSTTHAVSEPAEFVEQPSGVEADMNFEEDVPDNEVVDKNGYWISPSKQKLLNMTVRETRSVRNFRVGQRTHGFVDFLEPVDLSKFSDVSSQVCGRLVVFNDRSFCLYPTESERPPVGQGFNVKHRVTLYNIFPHSRETQEPIKDGGHPIAKKFLKRLKAQQGFVSWSAQMGTWTFEVDPSKLHK